MNWNQGLQRVSAVFWGFIAIACIMGGVASLFKNSGWGDALLLLTFPIPLYFAHKATCWIINGFSTPAK